MRDCGKLLVLPRIAAEGLCQGTWLWLKLRGSFDCVFREQGVILTNSLELNITYGHFNNLYVTLKVLLRDCGKVDKLLGRAVEEQVITVVSSGNSLPIIDLTKVCCTILLICNDMISHIYL